MVVNGFHREDITDIGKIRIPVCFMRDKLARLLGIDSLNNIQAPGTAGRTSDNGEEIMKPSVAGIILAYASGSDQQASLVVNTRSYPDVVLGLKLSAPAQNGPKCKPATARCVPLWQMACV